MSKTDCGSVFVLYTVQGAKMAIYCKLNTLRDLMFVMFAIMWVITRMTIYPLWYTLFNNIVASCRIRYGSTD